MVTHYEQTMNILVCIPLDGRVDALTDPLDCMYIQYYVLETFYYQESEKNIAASRQFRR
jgi:hypothetical protein